jgi:hypothetical protein
MNKWWLIGCGGCLGLLLIIALIGGGVAWFGMDALNKASEKSNQAIFGGSAPAGYTGLSLDTSAKAEETGSDNTANQDTAETSQPGPSGAPSAVGLYMNMVEKTMLIAMSGTMGNAEIASLITADEAALKPLIEQMMQSSKSDNARNQITAVRSTSITLNGQPYPAFEVETENSSGQLIPDVSGKRRGID